MSGGSLVFVAEAPSFAPIIEQLEDYAIIQLAARGRYMSALIDARAAMVFIDSALADWRDFVIAPKASAATRRIPLLLVSDDAQTRAAAISAGADLSLSWAELKGRCRRLVATHGRVPNAETLKRLECACKDALPPLAIEGIRQFNAGQFYRQHDLFEELWVATDGPVRDLYRAILQVGIACYHIERGNHRGALKMLQRSVQWLQILPDTCQGLDVAALRRDSYAIRAALENRGEHGTTDLLRAMIKPIRWTPPED